MRSAVELLGSAAEAMRRSPVRSGSAVRLPASGTLLVTGDLHDNPEHLRAIVRLARLDDSPDHHLVLHEIIHGERLVNGVDLSHRMLLLVAELVALHPAQVHVLLANHELAQLTGRGVTKGAGDSVQLFNDGLAFAFGDSWEAVADSINGLIRSMPLALHSRSGLLCAHSLPGPAAMAAFDAAILDRDLTDADYARGGSAYAMVWGRGYGPREVTMLAGRWNVRLFCLGHEHVANGIAVREPRVIVLNSDHEMATVVPIDLAGVPAAEEAILRAVRLRAVGVPEASSPAGRRRLLAPPAGRGRLPEQAPADRPVILAIETSQRRGSVALRDARGESHVERLSSPAGHEIDLIAAIDRLYRRLSIEPAQTGIVGVSVGPGGFTGLRIGVTTAKMLGESLGAAVFAVPSAQVAAQSYGGQGPILVVLASKGERAWVTKLERDGPVWSVTGGGRSAAALELEGIQAVLADSYLPAAMQSACREKTVKLVNPEFEALACLQLLTHLERRGQRVDPLDLAPIYPRPPEAVTSWDKRNPAS